MSPAGRAIVTGMIATYPVGGVAWDYGQYLLGLEALGWEVTYLEDTGWETYDPTKGAYGPDPTYGVGFLGRTLALLSPTLADRWHVRGLDGSTHGMDPGRLREAVASADLFLNVSGGTLLRDEYLACRCKVLVDTDPGWNHFVNFPKWDANPGWQGSHGWRAHDRFVTYAERIGRPGCLLPEAGVRWQTTRPPVALDRWRGEGAGDRWTTVLTWDNFRRTVAWEGRTFGTKEMEFPKIEGLPARNPGASFEIAAGGHAPPIDCWKAKGWRVVGSEAVSRTAEDYRGYVQGSRGELSVAKNLYVATRSGWFSCRSTCYLAAGRPVVVQDTGFSEVIPTGEGLLAFDDEDGAVRAVRAVEGDLVRHQRAAREIAREHFAAEKVLARLLADVGAPHP